MWRISQNELGVNMHKCHGVGTFSRVETRYGGDITINQDRTLTLSWQKNSTFVNGIAISLLAAGDIITQKRLNSNLVLRM